jgi:hypothetical protein
MMMYLGEIGGGMGIMLEMRGMDIEEIIKGMIKMRIRMGMGIERIRIKRGREMAMGEKVMAMSVDMDAKRIRMIVLFV